MLNYVIQNYAYSMGHETKKTESNETESFFKLKKLKFALENKQTKNISKRDPKEGCILKYSAPGHKNILQQ
jgi:hypothetical protein